MRLRKRSVSVRVIFGSVVVSFLVFSIGKSAAGETSAEDVTAALEEITAERSGKAIFFGRPLVTKEAQSGFARFGDEAVPELRKCVEEEGPVDPATALVLLGCLRGEAGWKLLEGYARGADVRLRSQSIRALGSLDTKRSVVLLKELTLARGTAGVATMSLGSLAGVHTWCEGPIGGPLQEGVVPLKDRPRSSAAIEALESLLLDGRCSRRPRVFAILETAAFESLSSMLPKLTEDSEAEMRLRTAKALRNADIPERAILCRKLARDEDAEVRFAAAETLVGLGDAAAVPVLAGFLGSQDKQQSWKAFHLARELESIEGLHERLLELLSSEDPEVACQAAGILHYHRDKRGFEFLVRELRTHRHPARGALRWAVTPDDLPALIPMMDDPDFELRRSVLGLILLFDDQRALDWVLRSFHRYDDFDRGYVCFMKEMMIKYVSRFPNDEVLWLLRIQVGRDKRIRDDVAQALSQIPNRGALSLLRRLLVGPRRYESYPELTGIARMGGREEVDLLLGCLERSKPGRQLYQQATRALQAITGENHEGDAWRAWWKEHRDAFDPIAARIESLSGPGYQASCFFLSHFGNERSREALRRELVRCRDVHLKPLHISKALALQGDRACLDYLLSEEHRSLALIEALRALHEATGIGARRDFLSMPERWQQKRAQEWREYSARGGEYDTDWRRKMFDAAWRMSRAFLELKPSNPALDEVLARFPSIPSDLRARLTNADGLVRDIAVRAVVDRRGAWRVPVLKAMLHDRDGGVRGRAALEMSRVKDVDISDTMVELLSSPDHATRGYAANWLGRQKVERAIPAMIAVYEKSLPSARSSIAHGLAQMADDSLTGFFARVFEEDPVRMGSCAVEAFSHMTPEVALPHLKRACADESWFVWYQAVKTIYAMEGRASYDWFLSCTKSPEPTLRAAGLFGVLHHKDRPFPKELVWKILHDDDPTARLGAMRRLGDGNIIGDKRIPVLQSYLREAGNDPKLRLEAAKHLAVYGDPLAVTEAVRLLKGDDRSLVWEAKRILERLGTLSRSPAAAKAPVLKGILADRELRVDALSVVVRLAGSTRDRELLRPIIQLLERGLDKLPAKRGYPEDRQRWSLLKAICSSLKEMTGREFIEPEAVSSEKDEIVEGILEWWREQPVTRQEE